MAAGTTASAVGHVPTADRVPTVRRVIARPATADAPTVRPALREPSVLIDQIDLSVPTDRHAQSATTARNDFRPDAPIAMP